MKKFLLSAVLLASAFSMSAQTIEQCYEWSEANFPLIKQYDLIKQSEDFTIQNATRDWLPKFTIGATTSYQSELTTLPGEEIDGFHGLHKELLGYSAILSVRQPLYDGGRLKAQTNAAKVEAEVRRKTIETNIYALRERVNSLFFGLLLLNEQTQLNNDLISLLNANLQRVELLVNEGLALNSDKETIQAEILMAEQNGARLAAAQKAYTEVLSLITAHEITDLRAPEFPAYTFQSPKRPELELYDLRIKSLDSEKAIYMAEVIPQVDFTANGLYGNRGFNLMNHNNRFNYVVGISFRWNIDGLFLRKSALGHLAIAKNMIENEKEVFKFQTTLEEKEKRANIESKRAILDKDNEIIRIRTSIREACEKKLENGVATSTDVIREITQESKARIDEATHRLDLLKEIYDLKTTLNN